MSLPTLQQLRQLIALPFRVEERGDREGAVTPEGEIWWRIDIPGVESATGAGALWALGQDIEKLRGILGPAGFNFEPVDERPPGLWNRRLSFYDGAQALVSLDLQADAEPRGVRKVAAGVVLLALLLAAVPLAAAPVPEDDPPCSAFDIRCCPGCRPPAIVSEWRPYA